MYNNTNVKHETYGNRNQILFAIEHQVSMGCVVAQSVGVVENGRKIAKAGTPITGNLDERTTAFTKATGANAVGVLLHDVDVTVAENNATILLFGFVNVNRIDETTRALITAEVKEALPMIKFVAC